MSPTLAGTEETHLSHCVVNAAVAGRGGRREAQGGLGCNRPARQILTKQQERYQTMCSTCTTTSTSNSSSSSNEYTVNGMTCSHCVTSVTEEVSQIEGIDQVEVDLATNYRKRI